MAGLCLLIAAAAGAAWVLTTRWSDLPPGAVPPAAFVAGAAAALALDPLPGLRAGPLAELADDRAATSAWLCLRTLILLGLAAGLVGVPALATGWRPGAELLIVAALAPAVIAAAKAAQLFLPRPDFRLPDQRDTAGPRSPAFRSRAGKLAWIDLGRRRAGLPIGVWAALCWSAALLTGLVEARPRLDPLIDIAAAALAFLGAVLTLRFDAAAARLLTFEPSSFFRLFRDVLGLRLGATAVVVAAVALVSGPAVLAGAGLAAGFRTLELLHGVRRPGASARLFAQLETALVLALAMVAGPVAAVWFLVRSAWLYRRAARDMGLA